MASLLDRLLGRPEPISEAKAVTGPGAFAMTYHQPWHSLSRQPNRLMAEGQALFHTNGWVAAAERRLSSSFVRMPWHLEDGDGKTVDESSDETLRAILRLLERPGPRSYRSGLWSITFRHLGLSGNAFWYLDQTEALNGTPLALMYINPARMTPALDRAGNVTGWVLDHPDNPVVNERSPEYRQGVPLSVEEVIHFTFDEPDWGIWGVGIPEAAQRKIELDRLADNHSGGVLASGGRLSGIVAPKTGSSLNGDEWGQFVRDWRTITSDPDAAKRLQISKQPIDFMQTTASPKDLQLIDVSKQGRDDILAQWGVPLSQLGINVPAGLNADRSEADDAAIWETIKGRGERMHEKIQFELLDRFDVPVNLIFDYPEFDDRSELFESISKAIYAPLTNDERRDLLGKEPLEDEEIGKAIYIASSMTRIDVEPEPVVSLTPPSGTTPPTPPDEAEVVEAVEGKASSLELLRSRIERAWEPKLREIVSNVLGAQQAFVRSKVEHATRKNDLSWWNPAREDRRFLAALEPALVTLTAEVATETGRLVRKPAKADSVVEKIIDALRSSIGLRVTGINNTTRERIQAVVSKGIQSGAAPLDIAAELDDTFGESRAEMISRTETMNVYNEAALRSYREYDVAQVQAIDGDDDAECSARDGHTYSLDEALSITDHPNGTLDWVPVV